MWVDQCKLICCESAEPTLRGPESGCGITRWVLVIERMHQEVGRCVVNSPERTQNAAHLAPRDVVEAMQRREWDVGNELP